MNSDLTIFLEQVPADRPARFAVFLSGSGSNAEKILQYAPLRAFAEPVVLVTDAPRRSRAAELGRTFHLPAAALDLKDFYRARGLATTSLADEKGRAVRELWTAELRRMLRQYAVDFGVLAGFEPLCNITADFPCLNVHPGDLSVTDAAGRRIFVGLHTRPVETALLSGLGYLRSSVIVARPFTGNGGDMDNGLLLGVSPQISVGLGEADRAALEAVRRSRPARRPPGGWNDELYRLARREQERLKRLGDHKIFPAIIRDFARRCFACRGNELLYRSSPEREFVPAGVLEYHGEEPPRVVAGLTLQGATRP